VRRTAQRSILVAVTVVALGFSAGAWLWQPSKIDFRSAAAILDDNVQPGDSLVVSPDNYRWSLGYYYPPALDPDSTDNFISGDPTLDGSPGESDEFDDAWIVTNLEITRPDAKLYMADEPGRIRVYRVEERQGTS
jgi:hypothetical protein